MTYYEQRLARIHAQHYTDVARAAAAFLVERVPTGLVIDVGCGAGDLSEAVTAAGLDYLGIDTSAAMLELARARYPQRRFEQGSAFDLPDIPAGAVVAVGEVLNYAADPRAGVTGLATWLRACRRILGPGGVVLLDVAGPLRADPEPTTRTITGEGYRMEVTTATDPARQVLTRTITISDADGVSTEVHELHLIDPAEVMSAARKAGFEVTALNGYANDAPLPRGWSAFLARVILEA